MRAWNSTRTLCVFCSLVGVFACSKPEEKAKPSVAAEATATAAASAEPAEKPAEAAAGPCKAEGQQPTELAVVNGEVYGLDADATHIYYSSWQLYGSRGDVAAVRKDGGGAQSLVSLRFQPQSLAVDDQHIFYTAGIRLQRTPKDGSTTDTIAEQFSAKGIDLFGEEIFGVPGDYGPYDRVAKVGKKGGTTTELMHSTRPKSTEGPNGFGRVVVDASGVYVADSGNKKILFVPLKGGKAKPLATAKQKPTDLVVTESSIYYALAKGPLMKVAKAGGKPTELVEPLVELPRLTGDDKALFTVLGAKEAGTPEVVARVEPGDGSMKMLSPLPATETVTGMLSDDRCVYWVQRVSAAKSRILALPR